MNAGEDELILIACAVSGDPDAFAALCEPHRDRLWRVVSSIASASDWDDLAQEAIIRAYKSLASYRGDAPFAAWLCRIAINTAHDYRKSAWKRRVVRLLELSDRETPVYDAPHDDFERREMQREVRQAVSELSESQRIAVWLVYFEQFTIAEVGRLEHVSESTIRSRLQAGMKRLVRPLSLLLNDLEVTGDPANAKGCET